MNTTLSAGLLAGLLLAAPTALALPQMQVNTDTLSPESRLTLSFAKPMVGPQDLDREIPNTLVDITPPLDSKLRWTSPDTATLAIRSLPVLGKTYSFHLREGLTFADGTAVEGGKLADLPAPQFLGDRVAQNGDPRTVEVVYRFNDAVSPESTAPYFTFRDKEGRTVAAEVRQARWEDLGSTYRLNPTRAQLAAGWKKPEEKDLKPGQELPTMVVVSPAAPLPVGERWQLQASPGIPNASLTAVTPAAHTEWIGNVAPTLVSEVEAVVEVNQPRRLRIDFNKALPADLTWTELREFISIRPEPANLELERHDNNRTLTFTGDFHVRSEWKVVVKEGLTATDGLPLEKPFSASPVFRNLAPRLAVASGDEAQLALGTRRYDIETVNLASFRLRIKALTDEHAVRAFQGYRHYSGDGPDNDAIGKRAPLPFELISGPVLADQTFTIDKGYDQSHLTTLDWREFLPEADPFALLFVSLEGTPKEGLETRHDQPVTTQAIVQLTDIGLAWKINDGEAFLYAYSCESGRPLPQVRLDLFGEDCKELHTARTDADGVARLPRLPEARHLRASWGDDTYLIAFDSTLPTVSMWRFPVRFAWDYEATPPRHVFLFSDRSLYRPGETVHLKGIVRQLEDDRFRHETKKAPQLVIRDSAGRVVLDREVPLSDHGSFDQSLTLPEETVGTFNVQLNWPDEVEAAGAIDDWRTRYIAERNATFSHSFRVEEFRRNAFEVSSELAAAGELGKLHYTLDANYYQGQPVAGGQVKWYLTADTTGFYPDGFRDYLFCDHREYDWYYWSHYFGYDEDGYYGRRSTSTNGELTLDAKGHAAFDHALEAEEFPAPRRVRITSEVTDARNQTLSSTASVTVHGARTYLGVSRVDRLIRVGDEIPLKVVALTPAGQPSGEPVSATLAIKRNYSEQVKLKAANGRVSVRNERKVEELGEQEVTVTPDDTAAGGALVSFAPTKPGRHTLTFSGTDATGTPFRTAVVFNVYGGDEYPWAYESGMKIRLIPEKPNYRPGETARLLVLSPIEGTALVTLERNGVQRHFVRELRSDNPVIEFPLTEAQAPNVFASVLVIKGSRDNLREVKEPILRLGYCELMVENVNERLAIDLEIPGTYHRPGEEVTITGRVRDASGAPVRNAEVTVWAEDEGTLAVMGYRNPNPLAYFYQPRQLHLKAGTSLETFISESPENRYFFNKGFFVGGGDGELDGPLDDLEVRENFDPCAHWSPALVTGPEGTFTVTFPSPDTLTRYRVLAVAHEGANRFGSSTSGFTVNKPLMLEPSVPRFASEGDTLHPKVLVQNASSHAGTWEVTFEPGGLTSFLDGPDRRQTKTVSLQPNHSETVGFSVRMTSTGTSNWTWSARPVALSGGQPLNRSLERELSDAVASRFEVSYPMPILRETRFVRFDGPQQGRDLLDTLNPGLLDGRGELELQFGKSLLLEADGAVDYLLRYPYGCLEQTTSSTLPWIAARRLRDHSPALANYGDAEIAKNIQAGTRRILSMQNSDGGFGYWPASGSSDLWTSAYGGMVLLLCRDGGAAVPDEAVESLVGFLTANLRDIDGKTDDWDLETLCRACHVLALAGSPQQPYHNKLVDQLDRLGPNARSFLALAIHETGGEEAAATASRILAHPAAPDGKSNHWMRYHNHEAFRLLALNRIDAAKADQEVAKLLASRNEQGHWHTTWANAWAFYALGDYAGLHEKVGETVTINLATSNGPRTVTLDQAQPTATVTLPLRQGLRALADSSGTAYVRVKLAAKPELGSQPPLSQGGFKIARSYHRVAPDGTTTPLREPQVGDLVRVELEVTVPSDHARYLVIDDALPSLFEAVNAEFGSQAGAARSRRDWRVSHQELRDDRALFFLDHVYTRGSYTLRYHARVTTAGEAVAPPAKIEAMYDPQSYALTASRTFTTN